MSMLQAFSDIVKGPVANLQRLSEQIGGEVAVQAKLFVQAFLAQTDFLKLSTERSAPSAAEKCALLASTSNVIKEIQNIREKYKRDGALFNHLSAISESIAALGWVSVAPAPAPFVREMGDAGQFYTNRVLRDWKEKDAKHVEWVKALLEIWSELQSFVKKYHTTGLVWSGKGAGGASLPPPPPPPMDMSAVVTTAGHDDRSALFQEINQGENITRNLKKVTPNMQTHKNTSLRMESNDTHVGSSCGTKNSPPGVKISEKKPPVMQQDGKKWQIEHFRDNNNLLVDKVEMNNVIYVFNCVNCTLTVKGKVNSIVMDSCSKFAIVFDTIVSSVEFVNCKSVKMQVMGKVPTISIDKTDGCQIFLNDQSVDVEIISSKSSEMNVMIPGESGDYSEYPIAEQFKTTTTLSGIKTVCIESRG